MAIEHLMSISPMGVAALCRDWFDEELDAEVAIAVAERGFSWYCQDGYYDVFHPTIANSIVWIKNRILEHHRALWKGPPTEPKLLEEIKYEQQLEERDEVREQIANGTFEPPALPKWTRSRISETYKMIYPIDSVANRVAHYEGQRSCPYCNRWYRNGAALRLHVIDNHLSEIE